MKIKLYGIIPDGYSGEGTMNYRVEIYKLGEVITDHFKYYDGLFSLIPFLINCRLSEKKARSLALDKSLEYERRRKDI